MEYAQSLIPRVDSVIEVELLEDDRFVVWMLLLRQLEMGSSLL